MQHMRTLLSLGVLMSMLLQIAPAAAAPVPFSDMDDSWFAYREAVQALKDRDVIDGYDDGTFRPKDTINRAELLKIVFRGKSDATPVGRRCFSDVNPDRWFAPYVCAAKRRGIVQGYANGTFRAESVVNMAEAIKIVLGAYDMHRTETSGEHWYDPYTSYLDEEGILDSASYLPWQELTRERAADLLWRVLRYAEEREVARNSAGCGKAVPSHVPDTVRVGDTNRDVLVTIPSSYTSHTPLSLVVAFHGRTNSNEMVRRYYGLDRAMKQSIVVYPAGLPKGNGSYSWSDPGDAPDRLRDIAFFDAIVETLSGLYCVDMDRIFVVGHSLGAWMANSVACARGDVVRGSATVGGDSAQGKPCSGPVAALIAHNPDDRLASFAATTRTLDQRLEGNVCGTEKTPAEPRSLLCEAVSSCGENTVLWCPHEQDTDERGVYYPHLWPQGMGEIIAAFFASLD